MPTLNSKLKIRDPFVMNEDEVNRAVAEFLLSRGFQNVIYLAGNEPGIDVKGIKDNWKIYVESKGSHANNHSNDVVFESNQIKTHTYMQICKLMEYANNTEQNVLLAMANPDIPRIRERVQKISKPIEKLGFIRLWVQQNGSVKVEYNSNQIEILQNLNLIK